MMTKLKSLFFASAALLAFAGSFAPSLQAGDTFAGQGNAGTTLSSYAIPADGNGTPRVQYINGTSDKSTSKFTFYTPGFSSLVTLATNASQAIVYAAGSLFSASDIVLLRHVSSASYERLVVSSTTSTNITFSSNLASAVVAGDILYKMTSKGTIPVGATTKEINAGSGGVFNGLYSKPILVDLDGTSAVTINVASGIYEKP